MTWRSAGGDGQEKTMALVVFPQSILVKVVTDDDGEDTLIAASTPGALHDTADCLDGELVVSSKTARYVLAGTGSIQHSAPVYVEDAKA